MAEKQISKKRKQEQEAKLKEEDDGFIKKDEVKYATVPPDGGFGWVVALAAMVLFFINNSYSLSLILNPIFSYVILFVMVHYLRLEQ